MKPVIITDRPKVVSSRELCQDIVSSILVEEAPNGIGAMWVRKDTATVQVNTLAVISTLIPHLPLLLIQQLFNGRVPPIGANYCWVQAVYSTRAPADDYCVTTWHCVDFSDEFMRKASNVSMINAAVAGACEELDNSLMHERKGSTSTQRWNVKVDLFLLPCCMRQYEDAT